MRPLYSAAAGVRPFAEFAEFFAATGSGFFSIGAGAGLEGCAASLSAPGSVEVEGSFPSVFAGSFFRSRCPLNLILLASVIEYRLDSLVPEDDDADENQGQKHAQNRVALAWRFRLCEHARSAQRRSLRRIRRSRLQRTRRMCCLQILRHVGTAESV